MSLEKYHNMYLEYVNRFINKKTDKKDHKIYEYMYALELDLINWDDLPPDFDEKFDIPHKMDYGIDLVDLDYTKSCQVKKYENTTITWSHLCKFKTYSSDILEIENGNIILATTNSAKIDKLGQKKLIDTGKIVLLRNEFDDLIEKYSKIKPKKNINKQVKNIEKRSYLLECYNTIISSNNSKIKCQLPCGCGKTYIMLYTIQQELIKNNELKFIIFIPWLDLARQTLNLYEKFDIKCEFIGNGKTELESNDYNVIICINPSVIHINKKINFRYKFIDEAHHLENEESKIKKKIDKVKSQKEIHFSATFHKTDDLDFNYSLRKAIDEKWVSDYVLHFSFFNDGDRMDAMINMLKGKPEYFPIFVYFNSTDRCKTFYEKLKENSISSNYLDTKMKECIEKRSKTRIRIDGLDVEDIEKAELQYEQIYNRFGEFISGKSNEEIWNNNLENVKKFMNEYNKRPNKNSKNENEKKMGSWVGSQLQNYKKNKNIMKEEKIRKSWEDFMNDDKYKKYFLSNKEIWYNYLENTIKFMNKYNKRPHANGKKNKDEKKLGEWINNQLNNYNKYIFIMKEEEIRKSWEKFVNDYNYKEYLLSNKKKWYNSLENIKKFMNENGKKPICKSKNKDEKKLGIWIDAQLNNYKKNIRIMKKEEIRKSWEEFLNNDKYKEYLLPNEKNWYNSLENIKKFIDKNGKRPNNNSKNKDEKKKGSWIGTQLKYYEKNIFIMKKEKIRKSWEKFVNDNRYKEYFQLNGKKKWYYILENTKNFMNENDKKPNYKSKNEDEKKLGIWINRQLENYKKNKFIMKKKEIRKSWEEFVNDYNYKEYLLSNKEKWYKSLENIKKFMNENGERPNQGSKNKNEKKMSAWIYVQLRNYKKNKFIMKKEEIRKSWEEFMNNDKYKAIITE